MVLGYPLNIVTMETQTMVMGAQRLAVSRKDTLARLSLAVLLHV